MSIANKTMAKWLSLATPEQKKALAQAAGTSVPHLHHIGQGRRQVYADLAQRLAAASRTLKVRALYLDQRLLCKACAGCPLVDKRKTAAA